VSREEEATPLGPVSSTPAQQIVESLTTPSQAPKRTRVLIVDDARSNRQFVAELVTARGLCDECLFAEDGLAAFKMLRTARVDMVVCDLDMPRCDGLKFLRLKATDPAFESIPVIVVTGAEDVGRKVQALTSGASDYVIKPFEPNELAARISVHLKLRRLQAELLQTNSQLQRLTQTDPLTDVANRRHLSERLEEEYMRARRYGRPLSVGMLDIDHFKKLNDSFGHQAGDYGLIEVAKRIKITLRSHDFVARYGGEEFVMVLPETPAERAVMACERLRMAVERSDLRWEGQRMPVTVSLGVASLPHASIHKAVDFITLADSALYDAKRAGRNRVVEAR
jgi:two-component system cell cycle response regulator